MNEPTTLKIYRGADGQYTLYDDDGISQGYLRGDSVQTLIKWDDSTKRLTLEPATKQGGRTANQMRAAARLPLKDPAATTSSCDYATQKAEREFKIEIIPDGVTKEIRYHGQRMELEF